MAFFTQSVVGSVRVCRVGGNRGSTACASQADIRQFRDCFSGLQFGCPRQKHRDRLILIGVLRHPKWRFHNLVLHPQVGTALEQGNTSLRMAVLGRQVQCGVARRDCLCMDGRADKETWWAGPWVGGGCSPVLLASDSFPVGQNRCVNRMVAHHVCGNRELTCAHPPPTPSLDRLDRLG